jgi:PEGA domain
VRIGPWRLLAYTVILVCFGVTGCSTSKFRIAIDSSPQGALVLVNNEYIGRTPLIYDTYGNADGSFRDVYAHHGYAQLIYTPSIKGWEWPAEITPDMRRGYFEFVAKPSSGKSDLHVQRKLFKTSYHFAKPDRIPEKIFFDLHQKPKQGNSPTEVAVLHGFEP